MAATDATPPRRADPVLGGLLVAAAAALAAFVWVLAGMAIDRTPAAGAGAANLRALQPFWIAGAMSWMLLGACWWRLARPTCEGAAPARRIGPVLAIVAVAAAARIVVVVTHAPCLSDDVHRYVFDGRNAAAGVHPYLVTPEERLGAAPRWPGEGEVAALVNNPELHTIYLPVSQYLFAACGTLVPERVDDPVRAAGVFRAVFTVLDIAVVALLLVHLLRTRRSPWWAALYAWHPLPVAEIAGSGHQDVIGVLLLVGALVLATGPRPRTLAAIALLAVGALVKPVVVPIAAFVLRRRPVRTWLLALLVGAAVVAVLAAPLLVPAPEALEHLRGTATRFSLKWAHFGSVYEPMLSAIEHLRPAWTNDRQEQLSRTICLVLLVAVGVLIWWRVREPWAASTHLLLAMVLLSPTAQPWYLLWALALVPVSRQPATWMASLTLPWGYAVLADTVGWTVPAVVMVAAYVPIYTVVLADLTKGRPAPTGTMTAR